MGLFDEQVASLKDIAGGWRENGTLREQSVGGHKEWPQGSSLVLQEDSALELGNPSIASLGMLLWTETEPVEGGRVSIVGPDLADAGGESLPYAQVLLVSGEFSSEYDSYRDLRDAVYDTRLQGLSVRRMPSRQTVWCKVSREALDAGLSLLDLGAAYIAALEGVEGVKAAEAYFVTSTAADVSLLAPAASGAQRLVEAMMKMYQEQNFDCETCEYQDVCDTVMDLKKIRKKLTEDKAV
jgi:CO dehydrogenase/acetyl-CoA synthase beta subunit